MKNTFDISEDVKNPIQPMIIDHHGVIRFKKNEIVNFLLENNGIYDLNNLPLLNFSNDDWAQFYQMIGYSVSGFGDCNGIDRTTRDIVDERLHHYINKYDTNEATELALRKRIEVLEKYIADNVRQGSELIDSGWI